MDDAGHIPVLPEQTLEAMSLAPGLTVLDATLGRGGHAAMILPRIQGGRYVGLDLDPGNLEFSRARLEPLAQDHGVQLDLFHLSFRQADRALAEADLRGVDRLLADLGFASNQMDDPARGLQFREDGPLDMRLDPTAPLTAEHLLATLGERELADTIYQLGEERLSRRIAARIVGQREAGSPIRTTGELAELVRRAYGPAARGRQRIDPATRTFMALRIAVNDELGALDRLLDLTPDLLHPGGRVAVIGFHSLEDRRVKQRFAEWERDGIGRRVTRKPITPSPAEAQANPRCRSAKLRVFERAEAADSTPKLNE